jgi:hypothetical protein
MDEAVTPRVRPVPLGPTSGSLLAWVAKLPPDALPPEVAAPASPEAPSVPSVINDARATETIRHRAPTRREVLRIASPSIWTTAGRRCHIPARSVAEPQPASKVRHTAKDGQGNSPMPPRWTGSPSRYTVEARHPATT